jgi:hypothetical protein
MIQRVYANRTPDKKGTFKPLKSITRYNTIVSLSTLFATMSHYLFGTEECLIGGGIGVLAERIAQFLEEVLQVLLLRRRALDSSQDLTDITAVVTVVEEGDVLVGTEGGEELGESARALRELEHEDALIGDFAASTDKEAQVTLGKLIVTQVPAGHTFCLELCHDLG